MTDDYAWEANLEHREEKFSIVQTPSVKEGGIRFEFIDDIKRTFAIKSQHGKKQSCVVRSSKPGTKSSKPKRRKNISTPSDVRSSKPDTKSSRPKRRKAVLTPNDGKKRRPRNSFILYRTVLQAKPEFKGRTQTELSREIAIRWQSESRETRAQFERAAEMEKGRLSLSMSTNITVFGYGAVDIFDIPLGVVNPESSLDAPGPIEGNLSDPDLVNSVGWDDGFPPPAGPVHQWDNSIAVEQTLQDSHMNNVGNGIPYCDGVKLSLNYLPASVESSDVYNSNTEAAESSYHLPVNRLPHYFEAVDPDTAYQLYCLLLDDQLSFNGCAFSCTSAYLARRYGSSQPELPVVEADYVERLPIEYFIISYRLFIKF